MLSGAALGGTSSPGDVDAVLSGSTTARGRGAATLKGGAGALTRREASARARSRGRTVVAWRDELDAQRRGLQAGVAKAVASGDAVTKTVAQLAFDLGVEQDWEYVMMRQPSDDVAFAGAAASSGASPDDGSGGGSSFVPITVGGGGLRAGGGKRDDSAGLATDRRRGADGESQLQRLQSSTMAAAADLPIEADGEHVLDLPQSWCPRLVRPNAQHSNPQQCYYSLL